MSTIHPKSYPRAAVLLFFLWFALVPLALLGQQQRVDRSYLHNSWQYEEGLPQNAVQAVIQTSDGYLWAGTPRGLARFDGVRFTHFTPDNTPELKTAHITAFCEARDGTFWIGTEDGLNCMKAGKFSYYSRTTGLAGNQIRGLFESKDGILWISTVTGLSQYKDGKFSIFAEKGWPTNAAIRAVSEGQDGTIWMATSPTGLFRWKDGTLTSFDYRRTTGIWGEGKGIPNDTIRVVYQDRRKNLWVGSNSGLTLFREKNCITFKQKDGLSDKIISSIFEDSEGNLWIGSYGGLNRLDPADFDRLLTITENDSDPVFRVQVNSEGVPYDLVNSICQDREGNIWVGSKDGLNRLKPRRFTSYTRAEGLTHNNVTSVREAKEGGLWIGTWGGGLNHYHDGKFTNFTSALVLGIHEDNKRVWFGTDYDAGLYELSGDRIELWGRPHGLKDNALRVIHRDRKDNMWIGTTTALVRFKNGKFTRFTVKDGLAGDLVRTILEDSNGDLWIGTSGGLSLWQNGKFINYTTTNGLSTNYVVGLYQDKEQSLWIATLGGGLNRYKNGKFTVYTKKQGLHTDEVFEIVEDDHDNLWLTSRFGVFRVSKKNFDDYDLGLVSAITSTSYGKHDGMVSLECSAVAKPSAWKSKDGLIWFATAKGLVSIDPKENLQINQAPLPVIIEQVLHDRSPIDPKKQDVRLPPGRGEMEFHFVALSYTDPLKNRFKYKLEGLDDHWTEAGIRRQTYYSKLPPGEYTFRVQACNNDGIWNETGASFSFYLQPHFYETKLFLVLCLIAVASSGAGIQFGRLRRLRRRQKELQDLVNERTRHLDEKTEHLSAEIAERERVQSEMESVQKELMEVSRIAGMAEVAAGILHNVGNVLNSANVSVTVLYDRLRKSRQGNLKKVVELLQQQPDLGTFFSCDERGRQLPDYLAKLSTHCAEEQADNLREIEALRGNIEHIKSIVAHQQTYGGVSGMIESFNPADLVEEALRLTGAEMARHSVRVSRALDSVPDVSSDKHKVLQIIVNLLKNASHACQESSETEKQVIVRTRAIGEDRIEVTVIDNGIGISAENLPKIFTQGFTTRAEGHGLGLHTSALLASQLAGVLKVQSDGTDKGATFLLELPRSKPGPGNR